MGQVKCQPTMQQTRFTIYFCKRVDLRVLNYAPSPRGRGCEWNLA